MRRLLNVGCGGAFHADWTNVDAAPADARVMAHDIRRGLPFEAAHFEAVYVSHVLEHLDPAAGARLLGECHRVLQPGGIVRVVVPDLETIARLYLQSLEAARAGDAAAEQRYDWMMLELFDQAVRTRPGGAMAAYLKGPHSEAQAAFIEGRVGGEAAFAMPGARRPLKRLVAALRRRAAGLGAWLFLGGEGRQALQEGLFRRSGEVHQWMYDSFSLRRALEQAGFAAARTCAADESAIPGFPGFGLETVAGKPRKPDSLYIEARKPGKGS